MKQQEKQINYTGPFVTMVFLFFIVGFLTTANTQFQGNFPFGSGRAEEYLRHSDNLFLVSCLSGLWWGRFILDQQIRL